MAVHGITAHEMLAKVDSGRIIATEYFPVPKGCNQLELVNLCIHNAAKLLQKLAKELIQKRDPEFTSSAWASHKTSKQMFASMCRLDTLMTKEELERRILAFGSGDGHSIPHIHQNQSTYFYQANDQTTSDQHTIDLHGLCFKKRNNN
jgi:methionyl-tRNA formyltransferase